MKRILKTLLEAVMESIIPIAAVIALIFLIVHLNKKHSEKFKAVQASTNIHAIVITNAYYEDKGMTLAASGFNGDISNSENATADLKPQTNGWENVTLSTYDFTAPTNVSPVHVGNIERDANGGYYFVSREVMLKYMSIGWLHGRIGGDEEEFKELADLIASGDTNKVAEFEVRYRAKHGSKNK